MALGYHEAANRRINPASSLRRAHWKVGENHTISGVEIGRRA